MKPSKLLKLTHERMEKMGPEAWARGAFAVDEKNAETTNAMRQEMDYLKKIVAEKDEAIRLARDSSGPYR